MRSRARGECWPCGHLLPQIRHLSIQTPLLLFHIFYHLLLLLLLLLLKFISSKPPSSSPWYVFLPTGWIVRSYILQSAHSRLALAHPGHRMIGCPWHARCLHSPHNWQILPRPNDRVICHCHVTCDCRCANVTTRLQASSPVWSPSWLEPLTIRFCLLHFSTVLIRMPSEKKF